jgi:hypothetical protein
MNTWERKAAGEVNVRFCNVASGDGDLINLVSPYMHIDSQELTPVDTLNESRWDIQRCLDFDICPTSSFTVRGQGVAQRVVLLESTIRAYALKDSRLCFAFGLWDAGTELCTLDRLVVPLFEAIYTDSSTSLTLEALFTDLRQHCETAFGVDYDTAINEFETVYNELRAPYAATSSVDMQSTVNTLLLRVFNVQPTSMSDRGIDSMLQYKQKAKCLRHAVQSSTLSTLKLSTNSCEDSRKTLKLCRVIYSSCNCLRVLDLSFMRLRITTFESLANAISTCKLLEALDLSRNHLHCGCLIQILESTAGCRRLQSFNWSGNRLGSAGTFLLANHITNNDAWKSSMREVKLRCCDVYNNMQQLTTALTLCTSLRTLDISGNAVLAHEVAALFQHLSIRSIDISHNFISDWGMRALLPLAMECNTLHELHVEGNHITRHSVRLLRKMKKTRGMQIHVPKASCFCDICNRA